MSPGGQIQQVEQNIPMWVEKIMFTYGRQKPFKDRLAHREIAQKNIYNSAAWKHFL